MGQITLRFLGTGTSQGIPVLGSDHPVCLSLDSRDKRQRTSALIHWQNFAVGIDCGPDFRNQMLSAGQKKLDALLFTHEHADHTAGLDDIRPYYFQTGSFKIYAAARVINSLNERFAYILSDENKYPGAPSVQINELTDQLFDLFGLKVLPLNAPHGHIEVTGFRMGGLAYFTDV
ncbi:MAG: MBL fold metallo-hydrolase, partial [Flavobacteriaceae bacterium]